MDPDQVSNPTPEAIRNLTREELVEVAAGKLKLDFDPEYIFDVYISGRKTKKELAKIFNLTPSTIETIIEEFEEFESSPNLEAMADDYKMEKI